jgi:hypothetical protein
MRYLTTLLSFVLACACVIVVRAQSQTTPGPEVKKLAVMVGKFTVEDEVKAGAMRPNSPATKFSGTDDCRWTAGGFAVICEAALYRPGRKYSEASFVYYDPTSKTYRYHAIDSSGGVENKTGTELHEGVREREGDSRRGHQARNIENGAVRLFHARRT